MQIRRVHVTIGDDRSIGQNGERRRYAGLARTAFAADNNEFLQASMSLPVLAGNHLMTVLHRAAGSRKATGEQNDQGQYHVAASRSFMNLLR